MTLEDIIDFLCDETAEQTLTAMPVVQAFGRENRNRERFGRDAEALVKAYESTTRLGIAFQSVAPALRTARFRPPAHPSCKFHGY